MRDDREPPAESGSGPLRRVVLRLLPSPPASSSSDEATIWVQDAPPLLEVVDDLGEPRVADLDALLRDVDGLRTSMRRDLGLAATAAAAGERDMAAWLVTQDDELHAFESRALSRLEALSSESADAVMSPAPSRRLLAAAPFAAAVALVFAFVTGVSTPTSPGTPLSPRVNNAAAFASYEQFTQLALEGASVGQISAAAERFHDELAPLVAAPVTDPAAVSHMIWLLQSERAVLIAGGASARELTHVLREADRLVARLRASLAKAGVVAPGLPPAMRPSAEPSRQPARSTAKPAKSSAKPAPASPTPSASPTPKPSPTATPKPTQTSSPQPSSSPSPSSGPTDPTGPLPKAPVARR